MAGRSDIPEHIEEHRDLRWCRDASRQVQGVAAAERLVEQLGFLGGFTDSRRPGPSLYLAVCGRRDATLPRAVQKDPETSLAWSIKDEILRRGRVYYAKLARGRPMFVAPRLIPFFNAVWGIKRAEEPRRLSAEARALLRVLRREWEMGTTDLREAARIRDRAACMRALGELQAAMLVIPSDVVYQPTFTYLWTLAISRFPNELSRRVDRDTGLREIARAFLTGAGMTVPGELARVTGLSRPDAGRGNRALVAEGYATSPARGMYLLAGAALR